MGVKVVTEMIVYTTNDGFALLRVWKLLEINE